MRGKYRSVLDTALAHKSVGRTCWWKNVGKDDYYSIRPKFLLGYGVRGGDTKKRWANCQLTSPSRWQLRIWWSFPNCFSRPSPLWRSIWPYMWSCILLSYRGSASGGPKLWNSRIRPWPPCCMIHSLDAPSCGQDTFSGLLNFELAWTHCTSDSDSDRTKLI